MKKNLLFLSLLTAMGLSIYSCKSTKETTQATSTPPANAVSYEADIKPLMIRSCAPCHFPETGKKKMLDTYNATKLNIDDIIRRMELPVDNGDYMPFHSKKPGMTPEEIQKFKDWVAQEMPK